MRCFPSLHSLWAPLLWIVAVLSMTVGNLAALRQQNVKRMLAYSSIAHAGYLLAAFAGLGTSGIAAASFYIAAYAAMNVGIFAVITLVSGYDEKLPLIDDFRGLHLPLAAARRPADLLPGLAGRHSLHRRILRQVLFLLGGGRRRSGLAGHHRPAELGIGGGVLSAPGPGRRRSAPVDSRRIRSAPAPQVGIAVGAALLLAVAATLVLGIVPGEVLRAAEAGAHTLQAPPPEPNANGIAIEPMHNP